MGDIIVAASSVVALPENPTAGGYDAWNGDWGTYPNVPFMFGELEGVVWPYPSSDREWREK